MSVHDIDPTNVDDLISKAEEALISEDVGSDDYVKALAALERLYKVRLSIVSDPIPEPPVIIEEIVEDKDRVRLKDWLPLIATISGTLIIVTAEAFGHTLTSKAWQERKSMK